MKFDISFDTEITQPFSPTTKNIPIFEELSRWIDTRKPIEVRGSFSPLTLTADTT